MNHSDSRPRVAPFLLAVGVLVGACSEDTKVGSEGLTDFEEQAQERLGEETTTTADPAAPEAVATTAPPQTTAPAPVDTAPTTAAPPTTAPQAAITVKIQGDGQGNAFEPSNQRVYVGSLVKFVNTDSVPRQVAARRGEWASPEIAPGGEWTYEANTVGLFEYTDDRPYAVGYLEVLAR